MLGKMLASISAGKKLAIFGLAFSLPLAVLLYLFISNINSDIAFTQAEKHGNSYQRLLGKLLHDVAQHKYLYEYAQSDAGLETQLARVTKRIDQEFSMLAKMDQELSGVLQTGPESLAKRKREHYQVAYLAKEWHDLKTQRGDSEQQHRHLIADIRALITYIGDTSNLILDPDLDSYYLMDVTLLGFPQMQNRLQEILSYGSSILRRDTISDAEKIQLSIYAALLKQSDLDRIQASIQKTLSEDRNFYGAYQSLQEKLPPLLQQNTTAVETFIRLLERMATSKLSGISVQQFRQAGEQAMAANFVFWEAANQELDGLLDSRLDYHRQYRLVSLLVALFTVFLSATILVFRGLYQHSSQLEQRVSERTAELEASNKELQTFSYSLAHDLRTPLRSIDGFSHALMEDYGDKLDATAKDYLQRTRAASQHMGQLIDDLLNLAYLARSDMHRQKVDLSAVAGKIVAALQRAQPNRQIKCIIAPDLTVDGDPHLLRVMLEQLLDNAWKFTSKHEHATIEFGQTRANGKPIYFVRDDGVGFDMAYANKLFGTFQRLHTPKEYVGTGIGLATAQRIIHRHGGDIWAEGTPGKGATFYFTL